MWLCYVISNGFLLGVLGGFLGGFLWILYLGLSLKKTPLGRNKVVILELFWVVFRFKLVE